MLLREQDAACIDAGPCCAAANSVISQQCHQRAAELLLDRLKLLRASPRSFAFMCDELSRTVERNGLPTSLVAKLSEFAEEALEAQFLQKFTHDLKTSVVRSNEYLNMHRLPWVLNHPWCPQSLGGETLRGKLQFNLDGNQAINMLTLLQQVTAQHGTTRWVHNNPPVLPLQTPQYAAGTTMGTVTSILCNRDALLYLPALLRLALALLVNHAGNLEDLDSMLGCPLELFPTELTEEATFSDLPASHRQAMLLCLFYADSWVRELLNGFWSAPQLPRCA